MAREIPTFTSERTTQIPSMGIVQQSGVREVARGLEARGAVYDQIGEYANKKADEFMERNQRLAAEQAVREGGLNPKDLSNPITAADRIYREAALNTYAIQVEDDIDKNLNRLYSESKYNPAGFQTKASSYLQGTIGGLAPELKNGVSKFAMADIRKKAFSLDQEYKSKILAESAALTEAKLNETAVKYVNAETPEEREAAFVKAASLINSDATTLTPELKAKQLETFTRKIALDAAVTDVMNSRTTPLAAVQSLKEAGVAVTPEVQMRIYNSHGVHDQFERKKQNAAREQAALAAEQVEDQLYSSLLNPDLSAEDMQSLKAQADQQLTALNVGAKDRYKVLSSFEDNFYDNVKPSPEIESYLNDIIETLDPQAEQIIKQGVRDGAIPATMGIEKLSELRTERGSVRNNSYFKQYEAEFLQQQFPLAVFYKTANDVPPSILPEWQQQNVAYQNHVRQINELVNNPDMEKRVSLEDAIAQQRGRSSQNLQTNQITRAVPPDNPERNVVQQMITDEEPVMRFFDPLAREADRVIDYNPKKPDATRQPTRDLEFKQFFDGPMNRENAVGRIRFYLKQNAMYYRYNPDGKSPPISFDVIQGIQDTFGIKDEDLR